MHRTLYDISTGENMIDKMKNIYTILEEINFEDDCKRAKHLADTGKFIPEQFIYSILQKFYDNVLNHVDTIAQQPHNRINEN